MLTVFFGNVGSGKTLFLTILAKYSKKHIVSNYWLKFKYETLDFDKFIRQGYEDCLILMDEAYNYLESRISNSLDNRLSSYIVFQSRKRLVDICITVQLISTIDLRYRSLVNYYIECQKIDDFFVYTIYDVDNNISKRIYLSINVAKQFYKLYNTYEVIQNERMLEDIQTQDDKNNCIIEYANNIIENHTSKKAITLNEVKLFCFKNEITNNYATIIYAQIKELEENIKNNKPKNKIKKRTNR